MKTKAEVEQVMNNAIRTASNYVAASVFRRKQRAEYMFEEILRHYPQMAFGKLSDKADTIKRFVITGGQGNLDREIMFQKMPETGKDALSISDTLRKQERKNKLKGRNVKMIMVDPDEIKNYKYLFNFRVNPQQRDSKSANAQEVKTKYELYMQNPLIDPQFATKMLLEANGDDPQEAIKQQPVQQPQAQQGQPNQQPQPQGQPQMQQRTPVRPTPPQMAQPQPQPMMQ